MSTIYNYRAWCIEEGNYVEQWGDSAPTLCPNNHADRTLDPNSISITERRADNRFTAEENSIGYFETGQIINEIPSGATGTTYQFDVSWDSDITLWRTVFSSSSNMIGDEIKVVAAPETTVGIVTSPVAISDTVIHVNNTVTDNVIRGFECILLNGLDKHTTVITNVDSLNNTITIKHPSPYAFANNTTVVKISIFIVKYLKIHNTIDIDIGLKGIKGKELKQGTIVRIYYTNNDGQAKTVYWRPEYYNNG